MADKFTIDGGSLFRQEPGEPNKRIVTATDDVEIVVAGVDGNANELFVAHVAPGDDIQAVFDLADGVLDLAVVLKPGAVYTVATKWRIGPRTTLEGNGAVVMAGAGLNDNVITNANPATGDPGITIHNLTIDGNKAAQTNPMPPSPAETYNMWTGDAIAGLALYRCGDLVLDNVRARNVNGRGVLLSGEGDHTRDVRLVNVSATNNAWDGVWISDAMRGVQYLGVSASGNGRHGVMIDHSEANTASVWAYNNAACGIVVNNVQACNLYGLNATVNGEHGIYILGLLYSHGGGWLAQNNGQSDTDGLGALGFADVYFTATIASPGYGVTDWTEIDGMSAGYNQPLTSGIPQREAYSVYVEDGLADARIKLTGIQPMRAGVVSDVRLPATSTKLYVEVYPTEFERRVILRGGDYFRADGYVRFEGKTTSGLPSASSIGDGAVTWDRTLVRPVWSSDGTWHSEFPRRHRIMNESGDILATDDLVSTGTSLVTLTLPGPGTIPEGHQVTVKNRSSGNITVATYGTGKTIDGQPTVTVAQNGVLRCVQLGGQWWTL